MSDQAPAFIPDTPATSAGGDKAAPDFIPDFIPDQPATPTLQGPIDLKSTVAPPLPTAPVMKGNFIQQGIDKATAPLSPDELQGLNPVTKFAARMGSGVAGALATPFAHPLQTAAGLYHSVMPDLDPNTGLPTASGAVESALGPAAPIIAHTVRGFVDQARTQGIPEALGNVAGGILGGEITGGVLRGAGQVGKGILSKGARGAAEDVVSDTLDANSAARDKAATQNAAAQAKAAEQNAKAAQKHAAKTQTIQAQNDAAQSDFEAAQAAHNDAVAKADEVNKAAAEDQTARGQYARQLQQTSSRLLNRIQRVQKTAKGNLDQSYTDIGEATAGQTVPLSNLSAAVSKAEGMLRGSAENIKVFRDIMARQPEIDEATGEIQETPSHPLYLAVQKAAQEAGEVLPGGAEAGTIPTTDANFKDLRGYYSELGEKLAGGNLPGDVYKAMRSLQDQIGTMLQKMANKSGVGGKYRTTQNLYRDYMQTFKESAGPNHSGSPIAQSLDAADPAYAIKPLTDPATAARVRNMLSRFDPAVNGVGGAGQLYDNFRNVSRQYEASGKLKPVAGPGEAPTPPTPKPLPQAPTPVQPKLTQPNIEKVGPENIQQAKAEGLQNQAERLRGASSMANALAGYAAVKSLLKGHPLAAGLDIAAKGAYTGIKSGMATFLDSPAVVNWLSKPSAEDLAQLARLPEAQRTVANAELQGLIEEARRRNIPVAPDLLAAAGVAESTHRFIPQVETGTVGGKTPQAPIMQPATTKMPDQGTAAGVEVLPEPFQRALSQVKFVRGGAAEDSSGRPAIASVDNNSGDTITVRDPKRMEPQVLAHELTHTVQNNLAPIIRSSFPANNPTAYFGPNDIYKLADLRKKGMTVRDLPEENQAQISQAYMQYYHDPELRSQLEPWMQDWNTLAQNQSNILPTPQNASGIVTTPRAPAPPMSAFAPR